jgi:hypothetical protein
MNNLSIFYLCGLWFIFGIVIGYNGDSFANDFQKVFGTAILEREELPPDDEGSEGVDFSDDTMDRDISIDVDEMEDLVVTANKTQILNTEGADDIDIDGFPPNDVSVIIRNDTIIVTANPVTVTMNELAPDIRDELIDAAKEMSNGSVVIDLPDDYPNMNTTTILPSSG